MKPNLDTSDPGKAADVFARAVILLTRVVGYHAENCLRDRCKERLAYDSNCFDALVDTYFPELREQ